MRMTAYTEYEVKTNAARAKHSQSEKKKTVPGVTRKTNVKESLNEGSQQIIVTLFRG